MSQQYVEAEYYGGGPRDGEITHMYKPATEMLFLVPTDVFYASANLPTIIEVYHVYKLNAQRGLERQRIWYEYQGYRQK